LILIHAYLGKFGTLEHAGRALGRHHIIALTPSDAVLAPFTVLASFSILLLFITQANHVVSLPEMQLFLALAARVTLIIHQAERPPHRVFFCRLDYELFKLGFPLLSTLIRLDRDATRA